MEAGVRVVSVVVGVVGRVCPLEFSIEPRVGPTKSQKNANQPQAKRNFEAAAIFPTVQKFGKN